VLSLWILLFICLEVVILTFALAGAIVKPVVALAGQKIRHEEVIVLMNK
jgi:hypothetical protein